MRLIIHTLFLGLMTLAMISCTAQYADNDKSGEKKLQVLKIGASQTELYMGLIAGKNVGVVANHTSLINNTHLVDTLIGSGIKVARILSPEHGFRGDRENGAIIAGGIDEKTGVQIVSLYGDHKKPTRNDLQGIDIVVFDIQDVGVRFYTYISTMSYVMESCAQQDISVIVLDRPNPNGFYVDGPVLQPEFTSFVGLHPVPIVYGMTIGEYATMANNEGWLGNGIECDLTIVPMKNYVMDSIYELPERPSPNLPNWQSIYLYPSLALFEGTFISVGRGTDFPFQILGHPEFHIGSYSFVPRSIPGSSLHPKYEGEQCYGQNITGYAENYKKNTNHLSLSFLINYYAYFSDQDFFNDYFNKLAGNASLRQQIESGMSEKEIRASWQEELDKFKLTREKYLLYD